MVKIVNIMIMRGNMGKKNGINVHVLMEIKNIIAHLAKNSSDLDRNIVFRLKIDIIIMRGNMGKRNGVNVFTFWWRSTTLFVFV